MAEANYVLNLPLSPTLPDIGCGWCSTSGVGSPEGVLARGVGASYVNTSNGDVYFKQSGSGTTGWTLLVGGGGGGAVQVYQGAFSDPNGNVTPADPTKPALYFPNGGGTTWQFDVPSQTWV